MVSKRIWREAFLRTISHPMALLSLVTVFLYIGVAVFSWTHIIASPWDRVIAQSYQAPSFDSLAHIFGTDILGRSVLFKTIQATQTALLVGFWSSLVAVLIGFILGALAGYFGGWVDDWIVWFYTVFSSIPGILLLIAIAFVLEKGLLTVCLAIGLTSWVGLCRIIRGEFLKHKEREYVLAAKAIGASHMSRIFRHILPNVFHQVVINFSLMFQAAIKTEVVLSYLGLGAQGRPSWGLMIDDSKLSLGRGVWWELGAATLALMILVLAVNLLSDSLRDSLDPQLIG